MKCQSCGVEVLESVLEQHAQSVPCHARTLARQAELRGLVRCEDAIASQLKGTQASVEMLKTGICTHTSVSRKHDPYDFMEEMWVDRVVLEILRSEAWTPEERVQAVNKYATWRKRYPHAPVRVPLAINQSYSLEIDRDVTISFTKRAGVIYDGCAHTQTILGGG